MSELESTASSSQGAGDPGDGPGSRQAEGRQHREPAQTDAGTDAEADADAVQTQEAARPQPPAQTSGASGASTPRPARRSWRGVARRGAALVCALVLACAVGGVTWWGQVHPLAATPRLAPVTVTQGGAQSVYVCPSSPTNTLQAVEVASMTTSTTVVPVGESASLSYADEPLREDSATTMDSAEGGVVVVEPGQEGQVASAAAFVTTLASGGDLRGLTAAPCVQPSATSWIVGGSTAPGASAQLRLENPGVTNVTANVAVYGSTGQLDLPSNGQVTVPAGSDTSLLLEAASANDPRLAVSVEAEGGSLAVALVTEELDGETAAGTDVLTGGAAPATDLVVPGVQVASPEEQGEVAQDSTGAVSSDSPVVRVVNPGNEPASVNVAMLGEEGSVPLPGAEGVVIDPGSVFDVSLEGVSPGTYGLQVTSDLPVAAAVQLVRSGGEYPERSGALVHDKAWIQASRQDALAASVLAVPRGEGLNSVVTLANGGRETSVTLASADGSWQEEVAVPAGGAIRVDVPDEVAAVTLTTSGERGAVAAATVVAARVSGDAAGVLLSVVPAEPDAAAAAAHRILLS
ncbi:hypothetical protein D4740_08930 [Actinomyces sp. 2119]|uniref:DUF5719 family protein n=1 Tax=Actinomyces sp. 2119 TaxID=2321393 RepID=UPI000E6C558C|nr:DUF5719 family protein [Actinomyces sp. 2119]RJF41502.1 hypothetical protein D4740_08930 [Actinomyces sp. 2119]